MAISRPVLLALLGVVLLGATVLAVQNARTGAENDAAPAAVQADPAPTAQQTPANATPADTLRTAFNLHDLKSAKFAAELSFGNRSQSARFNLRGAFQSGAANEMPEFDIHARISAGKQGAVTGGFVSLGDKAYFTRGDTGWRLPGEIWDPIVEAVATGGSAQAAPTFQLHPQTWVRDVKSEGTDSVGGVETEHVSASVDPKAIVHDLAQAAQANGAELPATDAVTRAFKRADVDVWVGKDDHILRRLSGAIVFAGNGRLELDVRLTDVNEPQKIEAPAHIRAGAPGGAFGQIAAGLVSGFSGGKTSLQALTSPNPGRAARAVRAHRKVVILFSNPRGLDDRAMAGVVRSVDQRTKAVVLTDPVEAVDRYGKLVEDLGVSQTPSVVIIDRSGKARLIEGFVDSDTLTQAVADAR
jgi:hypothetical protein